MNCTCNMPGNWAQLGRMLCPVHGRRGGRCIVCQGLGDQHATFCPHSKPPRVTFEEPDPWPDLESRPDEGVFEGMSRHGLCTLADKPVGESMRINGHEVWRWEESSPITQILSNGRPEGRVVLTQSWCIDHPDLGGPESALKRAVMRWAGTGRYWNREEAFGTWDIVIRWRSDFPGPGQALTHYAGEPIG